MKPHSMEKDLLHLRLIGLGREGEKGGRQGKRESIDRALNMKHWTSRMGKAELYILSVETASHNN